MWEISIIEIREEDKQMTKSSVWTLEGRLERGMFPKDIKWAVAQTQLNRLMQKRKRQLHHLIKGSIKKPLKMLAYEQRFDYLI